MKKSSVVIIAFALLSLWRVAAWAQADADMVGKVAPDFSLKNIDGKMVSLQQYQKEKGVIVIFTCNHCPFSKKYEDRILALDGQYKKQGFPVVAINPNDAQQYPEDSPAKMKERAKKKGFTFPYLVDETQVTAKAYGAMRTPHVYLLENMDGKFMVRYVGAIDDNADDATAVETRFLENAIAQVKGGQAPDPQHTKAIGCGIKWKKDASTN